jgi:hypothetical protein
MEDEATKMRYWLIVAQIAEDLGWTQEVELKKEFEAKVIPENTHP